MNELTTRILFAVPAAALLLGITWIGGWPFELLIGLMAIITIWEVNKILQKAGRPGILLLSLVIGCFVWFSVLIPAVIMSSVAAILLLVTIWAILDKKTVFSSKWLSSLFSGVYISVGFIMLVHIRELGTEIEGFWLALTLFLMIWGNDVFAYFGGKNFGKRKLAPVISPNKTWEGFWFGFAGSAVGFTIVYFIAGNYPLPFWAIIPGVLIVSTFGPMGDILESSLKRKAGVKDSSGILPGHGGMFDRFDSLILSAPLIFFYFYYLM